MITLTTPLAVSFNGVQKENNTQGVMTVLHYDFLSNVATVRFDTGSGAPAAFNIGVYPVPINFTVNMTTGAWMAVDATGVTLQTGIFTGAGFTSFQNQFKSIRNAAETFAAANFLLGTQTAWT